MELDYPLKYLRYSSTVLMEKGKDLGERFLIELIKFKRKPKSRVSEIGEHLLGF
jgi:hypothetical protein